MPEPNPNPNPNPDSNPNPNPILILTRYGQPPTESPPPSCPPSPGGESSDEEDEAVLIQRAQAQARAAAAATPSLAAIATSSPPPSSLAAAAAPSITPPAASPSITPASFTSASSASAPASAPASVTSTSVTSTSVPAVNGKRKAREVTVLSQKAGEESSRGGTVRTETRATKEPGLFTAAAYFWLYYEVFPATGMKVVPVGQLAEEGECHAVLDSAENFDADTVEGSNDTYEFVGSDAKQPDLLYTRVLSCVCTACRNASSVHTEYKDCKYLATCGKWQQRTTTTKDGITKKKNTKTLSAEAFAKEHLSKQALEGTDALFAVYSSYAERGGRPYWLLKVTKPAYKSRSKKKQDGVTFKQGTSLVEGQWYLSTSDEQQRRSYELLKETVIVPIDVLVQEVGLQFKRAGLHERILTDVSHVAIMSWNFSNVKGVQR